MRSSASHDGLQQISSGGGGGFSRVKNLRNLIANSPLRRRRTLSQSIDSGLPTTGSGVFGVPLVTLVTSEGAGVPKIIKRVVEHVDKYGLKEEGVYRINGSAKTIEKLKASFNAVGDADFTDVDVAAIAGLLKLFLRELPAPIIPPAIEAKMVDIQQKHPGEMTEEAGSLLRDCLSQLPALELAVFKYVVNHLSRVAQHSGANRMTAVALSIVFGPGIFHCGGGLEGMRLQGYANSVLCRFIAHKSILFQPSSSVVSPERPARPEPYTEHIRKKEGSPLSPEARSHARGLYAERSVDEAMDQSSDSLYFTPPSPPTLQVSSPSTPLSPTSPPLPPSSSSPSPDETPLKRQQPVRKGKHGVIRSWSADTSDHPARLISSDTSLHTSSSIKEPGPREQDDSLGRSFSPFSSSHASTSQSPPTSPSPSSSPALTPRSSKVISSVIEGSVKKYLFGPPSPGQQLPMETQANKPPSGKAQTDVYGLLLPSKSDSNSPALKKRKPHPQKSRDAHVTSDDITTIPSDPNSSTTGANEATALASVQLRRHESPSDERRERREGGRRNRQSVVVETDMEESGAEIQVFSRRSESKGGRLGVVVVESGRVSNLVRQFDEVDDPSQPEGLVQNEAPQKKKKMANKHFDMFEQTGLIMGLNRGNALPSSTPQQTPPRQLNREQQEEEEIVDQHQSDTLHHLTKTRPKGPGNRRLPGNRLSPLSPPHLSSSDSHVDEGRGEGGEREEEEQEKGEKKEDVDGLVVPEIRRHRRSPRRERKRKSPKSHHRQHHHQSVEVAPEDSATNNVAEGWTEETEGEIFRPSRPEPSAEDNQNSVAVPIWEKKSSSREGEMQREVVHREKAQLSEMTAGEDRETNRKKDRHSESSKKHSREDEREAKKLKEAEEREKKKLDTKMEAKSHADTKKLAVAERREAKKLRKQETSGEERGKTERGGKEEGKEREVVEEMEREGEGRERESVAGHTPGLEVTLKKLMTSLSRKRASSGRPEALQEMSQAQLLDEKNSVQRTLLHFEKIHGRPGTVADKELMRPLYERYRVVKKLLSAHRSSGTSSSAAAAAELLRQHQESTGGLPSAENTVTAGESTLPSITLLSSGLAHSLPLDSHPRSTSISDVAHSTSLSSAPSSSLSIPPSSSSLSTSSNDRVTVRKRVAERKGDEDERDGEDKRDTHSQLLSELFAQQESALAEKKRLRKILRDFESDFLSTHGRAATRDDRQPRQREYQEYKAIKEKLLKISNEINRATPLQKTL